MTIRAAKLVAPDLVHDLRMRRIVLKICRFAVTLQAIFVGKGLIQLNGQMHANPGVESDYVSHAIQFRVDWPQKRVVGVATVALIIENKPVLVMQSGECFGMRVGQVGDPGSHGVAA